MLFCINGTLVIMFNKRPTHDTVHHSFATDNDNDSTQYEHDQFSEDPRKHRTVNIPLHGNKVYGYFDQEESDIIINDENEGAEILDDSSHWGIDVYHPKKGPRINPELFNGSRIRLRRG